MTTFAALAPELQKCLPDLRTWCQGHGVKLGVLFGSQVIGKTHVHSDVDLAIWPIQLPPPRLRLRWQREVETIVNNNVSLVLVTIDLNAVLGFEIVRGGLPIFETEAGLWDEYRLHLWHVYNDSLPFRRAARQSLRQFIQEAKDEL